MMEHSVSAFVGVTALDVSRRPRDNFQPWWRRQKGEDLGREVGTSPGVFGTLKQGF